MVIEQDPEDKRSRLLSLTDDGHRLLNAAFPIWQQTHEEIEREFANGEVDKLREHLRALS